ncbi:hypothetical protein PV396_24415 [Streptomyces sp. ME02-8801-2C]|uniref:hypothetical protein n=1 Tax=Streptomyces sp. ME02-8801-2C TaxID=3028680 RepID=UPI0029B55CEA|nr:hypothetical protein [Streptomyces sp. ME02-8801-2C]MDX3455046.1 hypothetical protein [Streptomyces sp. ME02-8801-2C]
MRCVVNENFKVFHGHSPVKLEAGQIVSGSLADLLLRSARKKVTALPDEDQDATEGQQEKEPPPPPGSDDQKVPDPSAGANPTVPPPGGPQAELNIEASVKDVLVWVGEDIERARTALAAEQAKTSPRSTLVKPLEQLLADGGA